MEKQNATKKGRASAAAGDRLAITPGPSSVASSLHTLQVKSADGRVVSNEVSFQVSQPLDLHWALKFLEDYMNLLISATIILRN